MTQEDKELLLKNLCARLPNGVICQVDDGAAGLNDGKLVEIDISKELVRFDVDYYWDAYIDDVKPYLRPMSSMTEEEKNNLQSLHDIISDENYEDGYSPSAWNAITEWEDYCNARHLDYRGLIPKGLALEAPEDMYK